MLTLLKTITISWFIANSSLIDQPRMRLSKRNRLLGDLLNCEICLSFWVALFLTSSLSSALVITGIQVILHKLLGRI